MATRLVGVVIDTAGDEVELGRFWAGLLGWVVSHQAVDEIDLKADLSDPDGLELVFGPVPEAKTVKNRVHLDLASDSAAHQRELVDRALHLGASHVDIGQGEVPWVTLADPHGNEFCVLEPRAEYADTGAVAAVVLDTPAPDELAPFWSAATGWPVLRSQPEFASLRGPAGGPWLELLRSKDPKVVKNRWHLDIAPYAGDDQQAEVDRLIGLGAAHLDLGQGDMPWTVLTDPQGNEFCVLTSR